jgi:NDP-sugar pyrophosphorylase family protein
MVLAAGLGTRLRPLTNNRPKALVEIDGRTLLEITLRRLRSFGIEDVIINAHHFADLILRYLKTHDDFGMQIEVSVEDELLDTGGGLKKAAHFFEASVDEPFILHNVDVLSSIDLAKMVEFHCENDALATLAVRQRKSSRQLLFDEHLQLCGRHTEGQECAEIVKPSWQAQELAFAGIHVISPRIFGLIGGESIGRESIGGQEQKAFSIIPEYLRLAGEGASILGFRADEYYWRDLGTPESLKQAAKDIEQYLLTR